MLLANIKQASKTPLLGSPGVTGKRKRAEDALRRVDHDRELCTSKPASCQQQCLACSSASSSSQNIQHHIEEQNGENARLSRAKIVREPVAFYSQWRQRNVERLLDRMLVGVRHKLNSGITDAPYKHFPIQEPALQFAREHEMATELRIFSWERDSTGKRSFLVTTYKEFWRQYEECIPAHRHYYEIVQEGLPCHLYFDLEYSKPHNPDSDGQLLVDLVIKLACTKLKENFGVQIQPSCFIELDSSNDVKFSRHLTACAPGACFRSNAHVGKFIEEMLLLQEPLPECTEPLIEDAEPKADIGSLFVSKGNDQKKVCFIDRAVYTKNRAFRLMLSSKAGKTAILQPTGRLQPCADLKKTFMDSLICNTSPDARLLTCFEGDPPLLLNRVPESAARQSQAEQTCQCPFPEIETYILSHVAQNGLPGKLRNCVWWPETKLLLLNILGNRFCANVGRQHKSNGVYYVVDLQEAKICFHPLEPATRGSKVTHVQDGVWFQKCYDPDCRSFRSELMPLPITIWQGPKAEMKGSSQAEGGSARPDRRAGETMCGGPNINFWPEETADAEGVLKDDFWPDEAAAAGALSAIEGKVL